MKIKTWLRTVALTLVVCLGISCASTPKPTADNSPRFNEAASASVVLQFNSWDYIFMTSPDYRENGFLRQLKRDELGLAFTKTGVKRNLAVVVLGWNYEPAMLAQIVDQWKTVLTGYGFQRIVCLRPSSGTELNGAVIIDDSLQPGAEQTKTAKL